MFGNRACGRNKKPKKGVKDKKRESVWRKIKKVYVLLIFLKFICGGEKVLRTTA
jgi:hypothetical protein